MRRYINPATNETKVVRFKKRWVVFYPLFIIELLGHGFVIAAVLSILPLFAIINFFLYGGMMDRLYRKRGWQEINDFGQLVGAAPAVPATAAAAGATGGEDKP